VHSLRRLHSGGACGCASNSDAPRRRWDASLSALFAGAICALFGTAALGFVRLHSRITALESATKNAMEIKWKRARGCTGVPSRETPGSVGFDLRAAEGPLRVIPPGGRMLIPTGVMLELPPGVECQLRPRSGHALRAGVTILNSPATIDTDYRGELQVLLFNAGHEPFNVSPGDRIAQLVLCRVVMSPLKEVDDLIDTTRSSGGFGSTGTA